MPADPTEPTRSDPRPPPRRHRTPRYPVFLFTGSAAGLLVGVALALYGGGGDTVTTGAGVLGYFSAFGLIIGALLGGTIAVVVESAMNRASRKG